MPSSTSSSDPASAVALPRRDFFKIGAIAGASAAAVLTFMELFWRARGFRPELNDSDELWCRERDRAVQAGARAFAIVGSSRMQFGVDPSVLAAAGLPLEPFQLAIKGVPALPVLRDLVQDRAFRGTVLCEVTPQQFFSAKHPELESVPWVEFYHARPWLSPFEGELRFHVQSHLALVQPTLELRTVLLSRRLPRPIYLRLQANRFMEAHYSEIDPQRFQSALVARVEAEADPPSEADLNQLWRTLRSWNAELQRRGGRLIFIRMISSGPVLAREDALFPRARYWDRLLAEVPAPGIYFDEVEGAADMQCPDASHLDVRDARRFSGALARHLMTGGFLGTSGLSKT